MSPKEQYESRIKHLERKLQDKDMTINQKNLEIKRLRELVQLMGGKDE